MREELLLRTEAGAAGDSWSKCRLLRVPLVDGLEVLVASAAGCAQHRRYAVAASLPARMEPKIELGTQVILLCTYLLVLKKAKTRGKRELVFLWEWRRQERRAHRGSLWSLTLARASSRSAGILLVALRILRRCGTW